MKTIRSGVALLAAWLLAGSVAAQQAPSAPAPAAAAPPSAEDFVRPPQMGGVAISPSGRRMALLLTPASGRRVAAVLDLEQGAATRVVAAFSDADVESVRWVNDERLVYEAAQRGYQVDAWGAGIFAVDHDGGRPRQLVAWAHDTQSGNTRITTRVLPYGWFLYGTVDDGSADVLVYRQQFDSRGDVVSGRLARLDTHGGPLRDLTTGAPAFARQWILDGKNELRVVRVTRDGRDRLHWRAPGSDDWTLVSDRDAASEDTLVPRYLEGDDQLVVEAYNGGDARALFVYRLRERRLEREPLAALSGFDLAAQLETDARGHRIVGVHTRASKPMSLWFDEHLAGVQQAVDAALPPGRVNRIRCGRCDKDEHFVVVSRSDRQSGEFFHYDRRKNALRKLGQARPWLPESSQGRRSFHRVPARDGLSLPVVVTHPAGSTDDQALPAVVLVHGGPWLRGADLMWSAQAQFLASRGWRVLEVEFRGSTGFGWKHFRAGWREWGLAMQDDLADAVAWAARQRLLDPARVCIVGSNYGGYAALMGPIRHPGSYRCAASHAGVTDIELMYTATWGDLSDQSKRYSMPTLIGEPGRDEARLRAASPLQRVAEIKVPVLLAQGVHDRRVPREHADRFTSAARAAGVALERVDYEEGHSWTVPANQADFLRRLEAFLTQAIGR